MRPRARVRVEDHDGAAIAAVEGEIDISNVDRIETEVRGLVTNQSLGLVVDLSRTDYLDSAGINLLFALAAELRARQLALRIVVEPGTPIARMLAITALDRACPTFPGIAEALAEQDED